MTTTVVHPEGTSTMDTSTFEDMFMKYEPADPEKYSHIVRGEENDELWSNGMTAQDLANLARDLGKEITALCGHTYIPKHDPAEHDICQPCLRKWESLA